MSKKKSYRDVPFEVLEDYMRFAFYLGRRYTEYDFFLAIKGKSEQFRARNAIVQAALVYDSDYILMLDDDHVIDINKTLGPDTSYEFLKVLIGHLEADSKKGIIGALYYQRGGKCEPVIMEEYNGQYFFKTHEEVTGGLQKVDVTGGGCMLIRKEVFDKIPSPWFEPEFEYGTDIQVCRKAKQVGFEIWCDTSIELGHIKTEREVITSKNIAKHVKETDEWLARSDIQKAKPVFSTLSDYETDARLFSGKSMYELEELAIMYKDSNFGNFDINNLEDYYRGLGVNQLARNVIFHSNPGIKKNDVAILSMFNHTNGVPIKGLDFCCGSAPVGFELARRGHYVDFVDVPGSYAEEFVKWRSEKHKISCGFQLTDNYDWILLLDAIEHLHPEKFSSVFVNLISRLKSGGSVITNYFYNYDLMNVEHINQNKELVKQEFIKNGVYPINPYRWVKDPVILTELVGV